MVIRAMRCWREQRAGEKGEWERWRWRWRRNEVEYTEEEEERENTHAHRETCALVVKSLMHLPVFSVRRTAIGNLFVLLPSFDITFRLSCVSK